MQHFDYVILGGGLAGAHAAFSIRKKDPQSSLLVITNEPHLPYDRVPLSKDYLIGKLDRQKLFLRKEEFYRGSKIEILLRRVVTSLDVSNRIVVLDEGSEISFRKLLLATGGRPKRIQILGSDLDGVYYLRTIEDSDRLKAASATAKDVAIIGGGFIGCELASAFRKLGHPTTIVEMGPYLLNMALDEETCLWIGNYLKENGVEVKVGSSAQEFVARESETGGRRVQSVRTTDGGEIPASMVAIGIGISPNSELASKAGLKVDRGGVMVNEHLETEVEGIFSAGDVARFFSPLFERHLRVEHYDVAVGHGMLAGENMVVGDQRRSYRDIPHFFSYILDLKINASGDLTLRDRVVRRGSLDMEKGFFQFYLNKGRVEAVVAVNKKWEDIRKARDLVSLREDFSDPSILSDETRDLVSFVSGAEASRNK